MLKHGWTLKTWCQWEAVRKDYILYDFTKRKVQDRQIQRDTKWVTVQGWVWGEWEMNANGMEFLWEAMKYSCCLITKSCLTLCDPMEWSVLGFPVLHYLPEFAQTHVHWVSDAIPPSHPLSAPSPPALNLSQHQGLFQWVSSSHQVAKVLELQHQSFQWIFRVDFLYKRTRRPRQRGGYSGWLSSLDHALKSNLLLSTPFFL